MSVSLEESLSVFGNANHLAGFLANYETRLLEADEVSKCLTLAPNYFAWLNVAAEQVFYRLREMIYVNTDNEEAFDMQYSKLLNHLIDTHAPAPDELEPILLFAKIRHIIVHKGFPNPHAAPSEKARSIARGHGFSAEEVRRLAEEIREPKSFPKLREAHEQANLLIASFEKDFERDFGFMSISKRKR